MRTDFTNGFASALGKATTAPVLLLKLEWLGVASLSDLTLRLSDRPLVTGAETWSPMVVAWQGGGAESFRAVTVWNGVSNVVPGYPRFSDLLAVYPPELATLTLYRWFDGEELDETDLAPLFTGRMTDPIEFDGSEYRFGLEPFSEALGRKVFGSVLSTSDYPNLPEENLGIVKPIVVGAVTDTPGRRVRRVNRTHLTSVAVPGSTLLNAGSTAGFPASGGLVINDDKVTYSGITAQQFTGCSGISEFHYAGDEISEHISDHRFLFSDPAFPIESISNVRVAGQGVDPSGYNVDLARGEVVFLEQPREVSSIDTKFLQAQFDEVAGGNTALDPELAMQPNLRTRYARINQANRKLNLRQADILPALGQIGRVLLRVEHFMEERLSADSIAVSLSGLGQVGNLSPPGTDDRALTSGSTDITHNHLDTFGFPINIPTPVITPTSAADHVVEQGALSGTGKNLNLIAGLTTVNIVFPPAPGGALRGEYQVNLNVIGGLFGIGEATFYLHGQKVGQWNASRGNFDYTPSFTLNGSGQPATLTLSVGTNGGQWTVDLISVKRLLFYPHATAASQQSQQTVKSGGTTQVSQEPALSAVTEKPTRTVVDFFDVSDAVGDDWNWFTGREVEITYTGSGDGRTVFVLHTAFEIEYARRRLKATDAVSADVTGVIDDSSGTVTGTPQVLLERPDHVFAWSLRTLLGLPAAALDEASFTTAGTRFQNAVAGGYRLSGVIQDQQTLSAIWQEWMLNSRCRLSWNPAGQARLVFRPVNSSAGLGGQAVRTLDATRILLDPRTNKPRLCLRRGSVAGLNTQLNLAYARNWNASADQGRYRRWLRVQDAVQLGLYGAKEKNGGVVLNWCADDEVAGDLAEFYLAESARPPVALECDAVLEQMDLEPGDVVQLDFPDLGFSGVLAQLTRRGDLTGEEVPDGLHAVRLNFNLFPIEFLKELIAEGVLGNEAHLQTMLWNQSTPETFITSEGVSLLDLPATFLAIAGILESNGFQVAIADGSVTQIQEAALQATALGVVSEFSRAAESAFVAADGGWGVQPWGFSGWGGREILS